MTKRIPKEMARWIEENGFWMPISRTLVFDVLTETLYRIVYSKDGSQELVKATIR